MPFISALVAGAAAVAGAVGSAVAAVSAFTVGGFALGSTLVSLGLSVGLSALSSALATKPKKPIGGAQLQLSSGGSTPREAAFGRIATRGQMIFHNESGAKNKRMDIVYVLSDGRCESLESVWIGGKQKTLTPLADPQPGVKAFSIEGYDTKAEVRFHDGRPGQAADVALIANSSGRLSPDDRGAGLCYVAVTLTYDTKIFDSGLPEFLWEIKGLHCYDPRLDTTAGGSGSHRFDDPSTWAYTENSALIANQFLMGVYAEDEITVGAGTPQSDIIMSTVITAANICDEEVTLAAGGTEPRYRTAAIVSAGDGEYRAALRPLLEAMAGYLVENVGTYGLIAGAAQSIAATITDADLVLGEALRWQASKSRSERVNEVFGQFLDPSVGWAANSFPPVYSSTGRAEDGEPLRVPFDLEAVTSRTQAERVALIRLRESRRQASAGIAVGMHLNEIEGGQWIEWQSDRFSTTRTYFVAATQLNQNDTLTLTLAETGDEVFDWTSAEEGTPPEAGTVPSAPTTATNIEGFNVTLSQVTNLLGSSRPIATLTWTPPDDPTITDVVIEYRRVGGTVATRLIDASPEDGQFVIEGLAENEEYEFRATIRTTPVRATTTTAWIEGRTDVGLTGAPADVSNFKINVLGENATLTWDSSGESNISHYVIRYTPDTTSATWGAASVLAANVQAYRFTTPALAGSYLIKAMTKQSRESASAALIVSEITGTTANVVQDIVESPTFSGTKTNATVASSELKLTDATLLTGSYAFASTFDLGAIYPCRVTPFVTAYGSAIDNFMSSWTTLASVSSLSASDADTWSATLMARTTPDDPAGSPTWTAWEEIGVSDKIFRAIQFRLDLATTLPNITPVVTALSVRVDMPDRIISGKDVVCGTGGLTVSFSPAYKALTGLAIAGQNMATGDYATISAKSASGFTIIFRNSAGTAVSRTFDYVASGYGEVQ
jgi:hypothetical protein